MTKEYFKVMILLSLCISKIRSSSGHDDDDEGEISVPNPPKIHGKAVENISYVVGEEMEDLICIVEGSPTPAVIWLKNGKRLSSEEENTEFDARTGKAKFEFEKETAEEAAEGNYSCVVANFLGRANKTFVISVISKKADFSGTTTTTKIQYLSTSNSTNDEQHSLENMLYRS